MLRRVAHNAAFPDLTFADFELWFHQYDDAGSGLSF